MPTTPAISPVLWQRSVTPQFHTPRSALPVQAAPSWLSTRMVPSQLFVPTSLSYVSWLPSGAG